MAFDLWQTLGLQNKRADIRKSDPYEQVRPLLKQTAMQGFPELQTAANQQWQDTIMPGIQEQYRAKRRLGSGSTPEVAALAQAGRGLISDVTKTNANAKLQALLGFGSTPTQFSSEGVTTGGQNYMNMMLPLLASIFGGSMQQPFASNTTNLGTSGAGGSAAFDLAPYLADMPTGATFGLG